MLGGTNLSADIVDVSSSTSASGENFSFDTRSSIFEVSTADDVSAIAVFGSLCEEFSTPVER